VHKYAPGNIATDWRSTKNILQYESLAPPPNHE